MNVKLNFDLKRGGGGQAYHFGKKGFRARDWGKARTSLDIWRVVLGPYVQDCPCEASGQKLGQKN